MLDVGMTLLLKVKRITESARLPVRTNPSDAGLDLYADEDVRLLQNTTTKISTGIAIELPYGTVGLFLDRSSLGSKSIHNFAGVIDSSYRGELFVVLHNAGTTTYTINKGAKIAQLVVLPILLPTAYEVNELTSTERGDKGFGSSGV